MNIGVNLTNLYPGKIGGAEQYVRNVLTEMAKKRGVYIFVFTNTCSFSTFSDKKCMKIIEILETEDRDTQLSFWIDYKEIDIMFCPLFFIAPTNCPIPAVASILDVQHEFFPQYFSKKVLNDIRKFTSETLGQADAILTISEYSKQTIIDKYNVDGENICVSYLNSDSVFENVILEERKKQFKEKIGVDYIFYPANSWPHKNHINLLKAYVILKKEYNTRLKLVFTGDGKQKKADINKYIEENNLEEDIIYLGYLEQEDMPYVFSNATILAFPSLFEGFGIPLVEAMRAKVAIACSNCGSIPEIAADAALYFDANNPKDIAKKLYQLEKDESLRERLIKKGLTVANNYSWTKCADTTLNCLKNVLVKQSKEDKTRFSEEFPLVSIITPSYNQGDFIKATIDSVLLQDYPNIEYIVMDGGSTDNTVEILKSYGNKIIWKSEKDRGQADAVNKGIEIAHGEIIGWLNSDDTYLEGAVSRMVKYFKEHNNTEMVYGEGYYTDKEGNITTRYLTEKFNKKRLAEMCIICQPTAFFTKRIVKEVGMLDIDHQLSMDYDLWMRMAQKGKIDYIPEYIATSRMYKENKTLSRRTEVFEETCKAVKRHYNYVPITWIDGYADYLAEGTRGLKFILLDLWFFIRFNISNKKYFFKGLKTLLFGRIVMVKSIIHPEKYTEKYADDWVSREYYQSLQILNSSKYLKIEGNHIWPLKKDLVISVYLNNAKIGKCIVKENGEFSKKIKLPEENIYPKNVQLKLVMNSCFCPAKISHSNDKRQLSFILKNIALESEK